MDIGFAKIEDYKQLAELKWMHMEDDDVDYGEDNLTGIERDGFMEDYVTFLKTNSYYKIFVAMEDGLVLGTMYLGVLPKLPNPKSEAKSIGYLTSVYTRKEYRNQGVGSRLLVHLKKYAAQEKCELLFVWPSDHSRKWYERNGFSNQNEIFECGLSNTTD